MSHRQILLDTETTGLDPANGHRVIEIGAVEMVGRRLTGAQFHHYLNPERLVEEQAVAIHGLNNQFLADKPLFVEIASEFLAFIDGAELIIHNAPFDIKFLENELCLAKIVPHSILSRATVTDTLVMARGLHPGQKNSLDALCKRYKVSNSHRHLHGALLDADLLAKVYLAMTGGQKTMLLPDSDRSLNQATEEGLPKELKFVDRPVLSYGVTDEERLEHERVLGLLKKKG